MRKRSALPPIPATVPSILGPVPVERVKDLRNDVGQPLAGLWRGDPREVAVDAKISDVTAWTTYWHEWAHIVLADFGIRDVISHALAERLCDAFGNARVREMLDTSTRIK